MEVAKPNGWKGTKTDSWWTKESKYGMKYMCPKCGKKTLGIVWGDASRVMHFKECQYYPKDTPL